MQPKTLLLTTLALALLALAPAAAADPPGTCLVGDPGSTSNVCYGTGPATTVYTGSAGVGSDTVCVIGNVCAPVPVPTYDPNGGTPVTVPGAPTLTYVSVLGIVLYPQSVTCSTAPGARNTGVQLGDQCVTLDVIEGSQVCADGSTCVGPPADCAHTPIRVQNCLH